MDLNEMTYGIAVDVIVPTEAIGPIGGDGFELVACDDTTELADTATVAATLNGTATGPEGLHAVRGALVDAKGVGAIVGDSMIVSVAFDGDAPALARLVHLASHLEEGLSALGGSALSDDAYRTIRDGYAPLAAIGPNPPTFDAFGTCAATSDRFHGLDITSPIYSDDGNPTVAFRYFAPSLETSIVVGCIQMAVGVVQKAIESPRAATWSPEPFNVTHWLRKSGHYASELRRVFATLGWLPNFKQTPRGIFEPDGIKMIMSDMVHVASERDIARNTRFETVPVGTTVRVVGASGAPTTVARAELAAARARDRVVVAKRALESAESDLITAESAAQSARDREAEQLEREATDLARKAEATARKAAETAAKALADAKAAIAKLSPEAAEALRATIATLTGQSTTA